MPVFLYSEQIVGKMFRSPRNQGFLTEYFASLKQNREDDRVPKVRVPSEVVN